MQFFIMKIETNHNIILKLNDITIFDSKKDGLNRYYTLNHFMINGVNNMSFIIENENKIDKLSEALADFVIYISNSTDLTKRDKILYKFSENDLVSEEFENKKYFYTFNTEVIIDNFFTWKFKTSEKIDLDEKNKTQILSKIKELEKYIYAKDIIKLNELFFIRDEENSRGTYRDIEKVRSNLNFMFKKVFKGKSLIIEKTDNDKITFTLEAYGHIVYVQFNNNDGLMFKSEHGRMGYPLRLIKENGEYYFYK